MTRSDMAATLRRRKRSVSEQRLPEPARVQGKAPDGQIFDIPTTYSVLAGLFDPRLPKSAFDWVILTTFALQILVFCAISIRISRYAFMLYFALWRFAYNAGLGYILTRQSKSRWLVRMAQHYGLFDTKSRPQLAGWMRRQLEAKMGKDYQFDKLPIEFNVWLAFRCVVDLILLNDFLAYCFFGIAWLQFPVGHSIWMHATRWTLGWALVAFNIVVKMDAHRVVKDYAWYWGDAFFLTLQNLVFSGVFTLAPHPMYSVGYAGYYGLSLISGSHTVFFVSLAAHCSQFAFLTLFENPHIDRTYGKRKPLASRSPIPFDSNSEARPTSPFELDSTPPLTSASDSETEASDTDTLRERQRRQSPHTSSRNTQHDLNNRYFNRNLVLLSNWDFFRAADFNLALAISYIVLLPLYSSLSSHKRLYVSLGHAILWRCFHSFGLGIMLSKQSRQKWLTRHFLKHYFYSGSDSMSACVRDTFQNWTGLYNTSLIMTYLSFALLAVHASLLPATSASLQDSLLRYTFGVLLIALHVYVARETFETLGRFGWFYSDFFIEDYPHTLLYEGIFRFLNNPERIVGGAAFLGMAAISGSKLVAALAVFSILSHLLFLSYVETPHMRKLYGAAIRRESGFEAAVFSLAGQESKRRFSDATQGLRSRYGEFVETTKQSVDGLLERTRPLFTEYLKDRRRLLQNARDSLVIASTSDLQNLDLARYSIGLVGLHSTGILRVRLGQPIHIKWTACDKHSPADWVGLYRKGANKSKTHTSISSRGHWRGTMPEQWDGDLFIPSSTQQLADSGQLDFETFDTLPVRTGTYEARLHHAGKHSVVAISDPFEIYIDSASDIQSQKATELAARQLVCDCLHDRAENLPSSSKSTQYAHDSTASHDFTLADKRQAQVMSYAFKKAFGVELDPEVIIQTANVRELATRVFHARKLLNSAT